MHEVVPVLCQELERNLTSADVEEASYRALQATCPTISAGRSMAAAGDEGWLRSVAAKEAFLSGQFLQFCYQLLLHVWVHACNMVQCDLRKSAPASAPLQGMLGIRQAICRVTALGWHLHPTQGLAKHLFAQ